MTICEDKEDSPSRSSQNMKRCPTAWLSPSHLNASTLTMQPPPSCEALTHSMGQLPKTRVSSLVATHLQNTSTFPTSRPLVAASNLWYAPFSNPSPNTFLQSLTFLQRFFATQQTTTLFSATTLPLVYNSSPRHFLHNTFRTLHVSSATPLSLQFVSDTSHHHAFSTLPQHLLLAQYFFSEPFPHHSPRHHAPIPRENFTTAKLSTTFLPNTPFKAFLQHFFYLLLQHSSPTLFCPTLLSIAEKIQREDRSLILKPQLVESCPSTCQKIGAIAGANLDDPFQLCGPVKIVVINTIQIKQLVDCRTFLLREWIGDVATQACAIVVCCITLSFIKICSQAFFVSIQCTLASGAWGNKVTNGRAAQSVSIDTIRSVAERTVIIGQYKSVTLVDEIDPVLTTSVSDFLEQLLFVQH